MKQTESLLLSAAAVLLSSLIVVLGFRVQQLKELVDDLRPKPKVGLWVPPYQVAALDGSSVALGSPNKQFQVFYFFSPSCPVCKEAEPKIASIYKRVADTHAPIEMYGVSAAPANVLRNYSAEGRGAYPLIPLDQIKMVSLMQIHSVPTLIVVDKEGVIRWANIGPIDESAEQSLGKVIFTSQIN